MLSLQVKVFSSPFSLAARSSSSSCRNHGFRYNRETSTPHGYVIVHHHHDRCFDFEFILAQASSDDASDQAVFKNDRVIIWIVSRTGRKAFLLVNSNRNSCIQTHLHFTILSVGILWFAVDPTAMINWQTVRDNTSSIHWVLVYIIYYDSQPLGPRHWLPTLFHTELHWWSYSI